MCGFAVLADDAYKMRIAATARLYCSSVYQLGPYSSNNSNNSTNTVRGFTVCSGSRIIDLRCAEFAFSRVCKLTRLLLSDFFGVLETAAPKPAWHEGVRKLPAIIRRLCAVSGGKKL